MGLFTGSLPPERYDQQYMRKLINMLQSSFTYVLNNTRVQQSSITADSITVSVGTPTGDVTDIQTAHDGNFLDIQEIASAPAINVIVDFVDVIRFNRVSVLGGYDGASNHFVAIQLYDWTNTRWDTRASMQSGIHDTTTADGYGVDHYEFSVLGSDKYVGTGANIGKVRVRLYHTLTGNPSHDVHIDSVALYI